MRLLLFSLLLALFMMADTRLSLAQAPVSPPPTAVPPQPRTPGRALEGTPPAAQPASGLSLDVCLLEIENLREQQATLQAKPQDDEQKKKIELLQKEVETLEKMVKLLADQLKKQPAGGPAVEKLQGQAATLEARSLQAARRDEELAGAIGDLREQADARERYGPMLPAPLKELFLPSGTNETPLSIYGELSVGYSKILGDHNTSAAGATGPRRPTPGGFYFGEFSPHFFLGLNDWLFLEGEISVAANGVVSTPFAQADFIVNDWLTISAGRILAPIGWFNERINDPWVNKLPNDAPGSLPLLWLQVLPTTSLLGVQARGAFYLGSSPVKMEYVAYVSNGLNVTPATPGAPTIDELANLENMTNTFNIITNKKAVGGRVGFWWPEVGLEAGFSAMYNSDYIAGGFDNSLALWVVDLNFHKGNWDVRAEYGRTYQQTQPFFSPDIRRQGVHAQVAYQPRDCPNWFLRNFEVVYRYGYVDFEGINPTTLDLTRYTTPVDVPVRRQQHEFGIDYYFSPRMVLKCAYQINDEPGFHLHDNQFLTELSWGF
jgi:hypothetical protein